jgi:hypothetical protein
MKRQDFNKSDRKLQKLPPTLKFHHCNFYLAAGMSIPFRFKSSASDKSTVMAPIPQGSQQHHHRNTTKVSNKAYKSRFASKSQLRDQAKGKARKIQGSEGFKY